MKKLSLVALLVILSACKSEKGDAIHAQVLLTSVNATCVRFEVRDPTSDVPLETRWLARSDDDLQIAIFRGSLPEKVKLAARPYRDGECSENAQETLIPNGPYKTEEATFVKDSITQTSLMLVPGTDGDGDGYVATGEGGADCQDGQRAVNPGAQEACTDQADLNCDDRKGCQASTCGADACVRPPTNLALTLPASSVQYGTCTSAAIQMKDAGGRDTTVSTATVVGLEATPAGSMAFFSNSACSTSITSVNLAVGEGGATFYFRGQALGDITVSATAGALQDSKVAQIAPSPGNRLVFTTPARTVTAGTCSPAVQVQSQNAQGAAVPVTAATAVALAASPATGFRFYSDVGCTTEVTSANIPAGMSSASFFFKGTTVGTGTVTISATLTGIPAATQSVTLNPGPPTVAVFSPSSLTVGAGACTQVMLQAQDTFGNPSVVGSDQLFTFAASPATGFSVSDQPDCSNARTTFNIFSGNSSRTLYVRGTAVADVTLTATRAGFTTGTLTVKVNPGAPNKLAFTTNPQTILVGNCSAVATVQVQDFFNNPVPVSASTQIDLSSNSSGGMVFYSDAACGTSATFVTVPAGQTSASFYFKDTNAESVMITAASTGLTSATQTETIDPLPPDTLVFVTNPQTVAATGCSAINTVETWAGGTPSTVTAPTTVSFTAAPPTGFTFYSNSGCTTVANSVIIGMGQGSANFYFKGTAAGTVTITAAATGLTSATQQETITAQPAKLLFTTPARTTTAGACSAVVTVQPADGSNNPVPAATNITVNLSQSTPTDPGFKFYSDASCSTVITSNSVSIPARQNSASFYYKGDRAPRTVTLTAAATGLTSGTQDHTMVIGNAAALAFAAATPPQTLLAGACSSLRTVETRDAGGNLATNGATVTFSGSTTAEFFQDLNCSTPITGPVTIPPGNSSTSFYFKGFTGGINANGTLTLTASATGLTSGTQAETITPTVRTGSCTLGNTGGACGAIAPALLDENKAFVVFQAISTNTGSHQANVRCFVNSPTQVRCERADGNGSDVSIRWSVAEFPSGVNVQHLSVNCGPDTTNVPVPNNVTMNRTFLLLSSQRNTATMDSSVPRLAQLMAIDRAEIRKTGGCVGGENNHLQVVDYAGASVQRNVSVLTNGNLSTQVDLPSSVDLARSVLLYSYTTDGSGSAICNRALRGELTNSGTKVTFSRGDGNAANCVGSQFNVSWEVVEFPQGTVVQQVTQPLLSGAGGLVVPSPITTAVDLSRTIVIGGGQWASGQLHGEGAHSSSELISEMRAQAELTNNNTLTFTRTTSNNTAKFTAYVIQFKP